MDRRDFLSSTTLLALGLGAAACGGGSGSASSTTKAAAKPDLAARFAKYPVASEPNGDLAKVVWPSYVTDAPAEVKTLYEFQITHGDLMKWMPCFCGCGQNAGHRSNRDCYIKSVSADGSVIFDSMAPT
jgi:hypothetical protein